MTLKGLCRYERGQALVEMALVLPILVVLTLGVMTFGIAINTKIAVTTAAREAARSYAIYADEAQMRNIAYDTLRSALPCSDEEFNSSFNRYADVTYTVSGGYVRVTVKYHQSVYVPGLLTLLGGSRIGDSSGRLILSSTAVFKMES